MRVPQKRTFRDGLSDFRKWSKTFGIPAFALAGAGLMIAQHFIWSVVIIYVGLSMVLVEVIFDRAPPLLRVTKVTIVIVVVVAFTWLFVLAKAPLGFTPVLVEAPLPEGQQIGSIKWKSAYTKVGLTINNPTSRNFDDLSILIRSDFDIAGVTQLSDIPNCSVSMFGHPLLSLVAVAPNGERRVIPIKVLATNAGYRLHCDKLPANSTIILAIAAVDVIYDPVREEDGPNFLMKQPGLDFSYYYLGVDQFALYAPRPKPHSIYVDASYQSLLKPFRVRKDVKIQSPVDAITSLR